MNSGNGNDNLPPAIPPSKGNVPAPPKADTRRKNKRARQSGQKITPSEPVLPEIKQRPNPPSVPLAQPIPFAQQPKSTEAPTPLPKKPYPFKLVITILVISLIGFAGFGLFLLVSPDGRSIKVYTEPASEQPGLTK